MRKFIVLGLLLISILPEYVVTRRTYLLTDFQKAFFFRKIVGSFSIVDLVLALLCIVVFFYSSRNSDTKFYFSHRIKIYVFFVIIVTSFSLMNSYLRDNSNPLFFLKPLISVYMTYYIVKRLSFSIKEAGDLINIMTISIAFYSVVIFFKILTSQTEILGSFYYVPYQIFLFSGILLTLLFISKPRMHFFSILGMLSLLCTCLLGLVRSIWVSIGVAFMLIIFHRISFSNSNESPKTSNRIRRIILIFLGLFLLFLLNLKSNILYERLLSFNIFEPISPDAKGYQDNGDHMLEFNYAIEAVRSNWLSGAGIGAGWETSSVSFRGIAYGFHNSLFTVWFWFGLFGAILWIAFPIVLNNNFRKITIVGEPHILRVSRRRAFPIWIWAIFVPGLAFQSWYFTSQPNSIFFGIMIALLADRKIKETIDQN